MRQGRYSPDLWKEIHRNDRAGTLERIYQIVARNPDRSFIRIKTKVELTALLRGKVFSEQLKELCQCTFGLGSVIGGMIVHGKTVFDVRINFNRMFHARGSKSRLQPLPFLRREMRVDARNADVYFGAHLRGQKMGAVRLIGRQTRAMK